MLLEFNYEEITALSSGARDYLQLRRDREGSAVAAPPAAVGFVEELLPRLEGTIPVRTLGDQRRIEGAVEAVLLHLRAQMERWILVTHPAGEEAVAAYFDFAHVRVVLERIREMGREMRALFELMTGEPAVGPRAMAYVFPE